MAMSNDRVRFWIDYRYFQQRGMYDVLKKAFDLSEHRARKAQTGPYEGFWIVCRPSQFARFMIYRNEAGIKNGFMDLKADLFVPEKPNYYTMLADIAGITHDQAKRVALALCFSGGDDIGQRLARDHGKAAEVDVSQNPDLSSR